MSTAEFVRLVLHRLDWAILLYFLLVNALYGVLLVSAVFETRAHGRRSWGEHLRRLLSSEVAPSLTMLAPAFNEATNVVTSVRALLTLEYPDLEVLVINDGSTDDTVAVLVEAFEMYPVHPILRTAIPTKAVRGIYRSTINPGLVVVDKENGGKADALNVGLNVASGQLVCAIDADTLIEPDALLRMVRPFLSDDSVVAAGATIRIANGSQVHAGRVVSTQVPGRPVAGLQVGEYLRAFLFGRLGWNRLGGNLIISGAFGLFRTRDVITAGGYLHDTVGEDMELVARLREQSYRLDRPGKVVFIPDPVAWTEAPETLRVLGRQRDRWHRGLADVLWRHRRMLLNPRYRALGLVVYPYFLFVELLAPVVELIGIAGLIAGLWLGAVDPAFALLFFAVAYGLGVVFTLGALAIDEFSFHRYERIPDRLWMIVWALVENFGYRQLTVIWRVRGLFRYLRRNTEWGTMSRRGFSLPTS